MFANIQSFTTTSVHVWFIDIFYCKALYRTKSGTDATHWELQQNKEAKHGNPNSRCKENGGGLKISSFFVHRQICNGAAAATAGGAFPCSEIQKFLRPEIFHVLPLLFGLLSVECIYTSDKNVFDQNCGKWLAARKESCCGKKMRKNNDTEYRYKHAGYNECTNCQTEEYKRCLCLLKLHKNKFSLYCDIFVLFIKNHSID